SARAFLETAQSLEQRREVFLAVELEFHFAALAPGRDHDAGAESLLELGLPLFEIRQLALGRPRMRTPHSALWQASNAHAAVGAARTLRCAGPKSLSIRRSAPHPELRRPNPARAARERDPRTMFHVKPCPGPRAEVRANASSSSPTHAACRRAPRSDRAGAPPTRRARNMPSPPRSGSGSRAGCSRRARTPASGDRERRERAPESARARQTQPRANAVRPRRAGNRLAGRAARSRAAAPRSP